MFDKRIEMGKKYPIVVDVDYTNTIVDRAASYLAEIAYQNDLREGNTKEQLKVLLATYLGGSFYRNSGKENGKITKRIRDLFKDRFGYKLTSKELSEIGNIYSTHKPNEYYAVFTYGCDGDARDYLNEGSCWWSDEDYGHSRNYLAASNGGACMIYDASTDKALYRTWFVPLESRYNGMVLFNKYEAYRAPVADLVFIGDTVKHLLEDALGSELIGKKITFRAKYEGLGEGSIYINVNSGYLLQDKSTLIPTNTIYDSHRHPFVWENIYEVELEDHYYCEQCYDNYHIDDMLQVIVEDRGNYTELWCEDCARHSAYYDEHYEQYFSDSCTIVETVDGMWAAIEYDLYHDEVYVYCIHEDVYVHSHDDEYTYIEALDSYVHDLETVVEKEGLWLCSDCNEWKLDQDTSHETNTGCICDECQADRLEEREGLYQEHFLNLGE